MGSEGEDCHITIRLPARVNKRWPRFGASFSKVLRLSAGPCSRRRHESDEVEHAFRSDHARRSGAQRRVGIFIALFAWIAYSAVDYMNVGAGSGAETLFPKVLSLRILGTVAIAIGAFLASRPKFLQDDTYSGRMVCIFVSLCYLLLLGMVVTIEFPFSYVVDYPGLILYVLFVLGLLLRNPLISRTA